MQGAGKPKDEAAEPQRPPVLMVTSTAIELCSISQDGCNCLMHSSHWKMDTKPQAGQNEEEGGGRVGPDIKECKL